MFARIVVPLDGSPEAEESLTYAEEFARRFDSTVYLLEVTPGYGQLAMATTATPFAATPAMAEAAVEAVEDAAESASEYLLGLCKDRDRGRWRPVVVTGDSATEIVDKAKELGADLIIVASHSRSGLKRLLLGSVAEDVVRHAAIPVLVLHRD